MEQIDLLRIPSVDRTSSPAPCKPLLPADRKTREVDLRILRFDDVVKHTQTYGKLMEDGTYKVITKNSILKLIDEEDEDEAEFSKWELIDLEKELNELLEKVNKGLPIEPQEAIILPRAKSFFLRLEQLFDGRDTLPFPLAKPGEHVPERRNRENSAGVITKTFGFSTISSQDEDGAWQTDPKLLETLNKLHDQALVEFSVEMKMPSKKELGKKMMALREMDRKVTFTVDELCAFYLHNCRAKERMMTYDIKAKIEAAKSVQEKQEIIEKYHSLNWIPFDEKAKTFDQKFLKNNLKDVLEVEFDEDSLEAKYSSVTEKDIKEFIIKKYLL